ncbi:MAG TPA: hypothetical protein VF245_06865 [Solirubrobacterales bacterium]
MADGAHNSDLGPGEAPPAEAPPVVEYHFPVEVEVRTSPSALDPEAIADLALQRLARGLRGV